MTPGIWHPPNSSIIDAVTVAGHTRTTSHGRAHAPPVTTGQQVSDATATSLHLDGASGISGIIANPA